MSVRSKSADLFVVFGHFALSLEDDDGHCRLVIRSCREDLFLLCWDRRVALDERSHDAAECFDTECQRDDVEQENVFDIAGENSRLGSQRR